MVPPKNRCVQPLHRDGVPGNTLLDAQIDRQGTCRTCLLYTHGLPIEVPFLDPAGSPVRALSGRRWRISIGGDAGRARPPGSHMSPPVRPTTTSLVRDSPSLAAPARTPENAGAKADGEALDAAPATRARRLLHIGIPAAVSATFKPLPDSQTACSRSRLRLKIVRSHLWGSRCHGIAPHYAAQ